MKAANSDMNKNIHIEYATGLDFNTLMDKYIVFIVDSESFDYYDLNSGKETFCMTYQETCKAIEEGKYRIVTVSLANLRFWVNYIEKGYRIFIIIGGKKVPIYDGTFVGDFQIRRTTNIESLIINGGFDKN